MIDLTKIDEIVTNELVAFYNQHTDKPIKKFQDRATAERRVKELLDGLQEREKLANQRAVTAFHQFGAECIAQSRLQDDMDEALRRSESIKKTWKDQETRRKRTQRSAVLVDGKEYRSVRAAFEFLGLPMNEHIAFRMSLKAHGSMKAYEGRFWKIIPLRR